MTKQDTTFAAICNKIVAQNHALIQRLDAQDFNPGVELDNTRNNASYVLTDFFSVLKGYPYGEVPYRIADEVVQTTDALIDAIRSRYPEKEILTLAHKAGLAFRRSKRIWRIRKPPKPLTSAEYELALDTCLADILDALDDLNAALDQHAFASAAKPPRKTKPKCGGKGPQTDYKLQQRKALVKFLERKPITRSFSAITRAHQCWNEHKQEWDAAAEKGIGYYDYKSLARAV